MLRSRAPSPVPLEPLPPRRKWRAITIASLLLLPAYLGIVVGLVTVASDRPDAPPAGPPIAFGLGLLPFVFLAFALLSSHPHAPGAAAKAMGLSLLVGIPVAALVPDAVTGLVAGIGAGGAAALRPEPVGSWRARAIGVAAVSVYVAVMVRVVPDVAVLLAPTLPFTCLGVADHLAEARRTAHEDTPNADPS
jgi:hypothetical protein